MERYIEVDNNASKKELYLSIIPQIRSLIEDEHDLIANLGNVAAALKMAFPRFSWVGFYLMKDGELVLGSFQGKPGCVRIPAGKGVCGTAVLKKQTIVVPDVNQFPGHIACDPDSQSEIVVPLFVNEKIFGVLDVDSAVLNNFDHIDQQYLEELVSLVVKKFDA